MQDENNKISRVPKEVTGSNNTGKRRRRRLSRLKKHFPLIGEMLFSLLIMPLAFTFLYNAFEGVITQDSAQLITEIPADSFPYLVLTYFAMGIVRICRAFRLREKSDFEFKRYMLYGIGILAATVIMAIKGDSLLSRAVSGVYILTLVIDRVIAILRKPVARTIILNVLIGAMLTIMYVKLVRGADIYFVAAFLGVMGAIYTNLAFVFGRLDRKMIRSIIRQTYAAEIVGGLIFLIFTFSFLFILFEEGIPTFSDALWYCFAIVTTIGFGDLSAVTLPGRIMSVILGVYGIIVVALITSIIVAFYGEMKKEGVMNDEDEEEDW